MPPAAILWVAYPNFSRIAIDDDGPALRLKRAG
jgi:hypothetical protein